MKIDGNAVKWILILGGATVAGFAIYSAYKKVSASISTAEKAVADIPYMVGRTVAESATNFVNTAKDSISNVWTDVKKSVGISSDIGSNSTRELPISEWPASSKAAIDAILKNRGVGAHGYAGWKVFDTGTIISPWGDIMQDNLMSSVNSSDFNASSIGLYSATDNVFTPSGSGYDLLTYVPPTGGASASW